MTLSKIIEYKDTGRRHIAFRDKVYYLLTKKLKLRFNILLNLFKIKIKFNIVGQVR